MLGCCEVRPRLCRCPRPQRGESRMRPCWSCFLHNGKLRLDAPARWGGGRHGPLGASQTLGPDAAQAQHYPIGCSSCKQTHVLLERPSFHGESARIRCQQCQVQVRVSRCTCLTCGSFLSKCRCATHEIGDRGRQSALTGFFRRAPARPGPPLNTGETGTSGISPAHLAAGPQRTSGQVSSRHDGMRRLNAGVVRPSLAAWLRGMTPERAAPA